MNQFDQFLRGETNELNFSNYSKEDVLKVLARSGEIIKIINAECDERGIFKIG